MIKMIDYLLEGTRVAMTSNGYAPRGCSIQFLDPSKKEPSHQKNVEHQQNVIFFPESTQERQKPQWP